MSDKPDPGIGAHMAATAKWRRGEPEAFIKLQEAMLVEKDQEIARLKGQLKANQDDADKGREFALTAVKRMDQRIEAMAALLDRVPHTNLADRAFRDAQAIAVGGQNTFLGYVPCRDDCPACAWAALKACE